jgi:phosphate transport system permease protein
MMWRRQSGPKLAQFLANCALWSLTVATLALLLFIIVFVLRHGLREVSQEFLTTGPRDMGRQGGILPMIIGTLYVTALGVLLATPIGLCTAIYLSEYIRDGWLTRLIRFGAECLAGVPSIIFGLFGFVFFIIYLGMGWSVLAGGLTLGFMILPTLIRTAEEALRAVPAAYREVSYTLGASKWQAIVKVVLPAALPGIVTGVVLGIGRCLSETAAVIFTAGSSLKTPLSLFDPARTLSVHFYLLAREGISMQKAYATAAVLVISILFINITAYTLMHRYMRRFR